MLITKPPPRWGGGGGLPTNTPIISAGQFHTLAILDGKLYAWGSNKYGQLGNGKTGGNEKLPVRIGSETNWVTVSAGSMSAGSGISHSLAINELGELWAWGSNESGQLGLGDLTDRKTPTKVGDQTNWVAVSAGPHNSIAINSKGELWGWGYNYYGQLGDWTGKETVPVRIGNKSNWVNISIDDRVVAINALGELWSWGAVNIATGDTRGYPTPVKVGEETNWVNINVAGTIMYAINNLGELWSWRWKRSEYFPNSYPTPVLIDDNQVWISIESGFNCIFAINVSGELWVRGSSTFGQLGLGDITTCSVLTKIGNQTNWKSISASSSVFGSHVIAINSLGELWTWGYNSNGTLGLGDEIDRNEPTLVGYNVVAPSDITGITFSVPSATRVKIGGSYTFTATLATGYTLPIIQLTCAGKTIARIAFTSMNNNIYTYTVCDVSADITASHFTRAVSRIN